MKRAICNTNTKCSDINGYFLTETETGAHDNVQLAMKIAFSLRLIEYFFNLEAFDSG